MFYHQSFNINTSIQSIIVTEVSSSNICFFFSSFPPSFSHCHHHSYPPPALSITYSSLALLRTLPNPPILHQSPTHSSQISSKDLIHSCSLQLTSPIVVRYLLVAFHQLCPYSFQEKRVLLWFLVVRGDCRCFNSVLVGQGTEDCCW